MDHMDSGLRERQKARTRSAIQDAATRLFLRSGFPAVGVDEIAAAAEVSKRTLFKYFPSKEDLVIGAFADHADEAARTVTDRPDGIGPLAALRARFLDGLADRDPVTGLDDRPETLAFVAMVLDAPALRSRLLLYQANSEASLAAALAFAEPFDGAARIAACQIVAVQRVLAEDNRRHLTGGMSADERYPGAVEAAGRAFDILRDGLGSAY
jgi:AcrR family transcriptional regulator